MDHTFYDTMLLKHGARLCKHFKKGGLPDDEVGDMIIKNIVQHIAKTPKILQRCQQVNVQGDTLYDFLSRAVIDLSPKLIMTQQGKPDNLLSVYLLTSANIDNPLNALKEMKVGDYSHQEIRSNPTLENEIISVFIDASWDLCENSPNHNFSLFSVEQGSGISRSEASGCSCFPYILGLIIGIIIYFIFK